MFASLSVRFTAAPWVFDLLTHLWQSTAVACAILALISFCGALSAGTRRTLGWIALAKFAIPAAWLVKLLERASGTPKPWLASDGWQLPMNISPIEPFAAVPDRGVSVGQIALAIWAIGSLGLIVAWTLRGMRARHRIFATATAAPEELSSQLPEAAARVGLRQPPRCAIVAPEHGPGLVGILSPVLIFPRGLVESLQAAELRAIMVHEFVHLRRRDNLWSAGRALFVALLWFNPIAWWLNRTLDLETEKSCDERVLELTGDPDAYANGIVTAVRHNLGLIQSGFAAATTPPVVGRLNAILAFSHRRDRPVTRRAVLLAGIGLVALSGRMGAIAAGTAIAEQAAAVAADAAPLRVVLTPKAAAAASSSPEEARQRRDEANSARIQQAAQRALEGKAARDTPAAPTANPPPDLRSVEEELARAQAKAAAANAELKSLQDEREAAVRKQREAEALEGRVRTVEARAAEARKSAPAIMAAKKSELRPSAERSVALPRIIPPGDTPASYQGAKLFDISELDQAPVARFQARPQYPFEMRRNGIGGEVVVDFIVDPNGDVQYAQSIRSSREEFEASAVHSVSKWKFKPGRKEGRDVATHMQVPIVFTLR